MKKNKVKLLIRELALIGLKVSIITGILIIFSFFFSMNYIPSASMTPTLKTGDIVVGRKFGLDNIKAGDVITFNAPEKEEGLFIKRIIGVPGDELEITEKTVMVNGNIVSCLNSKDFKDRLNVGRYTIPEDCYFVMGDNRAYSYDSRYFPQMYIKKEDVKSKVLFRLYPIIKPLNSEYGEEDKGSK